MIGENFHFFYYENTNYNRHIHQKQNYKNILYDNELYRVFIA